MPATPDYSKSRNKYEEYAEKSYVNKDSFNYNDLPTTTSSKFFPCSDTKNFYIDTLFYLHLYTGLYFEFVKFNITNKNNVQKFKELINSLQIIIKNSVPGAKLMTLSNTTITIDLAVFNNNALKTTYSDYYDTTGADLGQITNDRREEYNKYFPVLDNIEKITTGSDLIEPAASILTLLSLFGYVSSDGSTSESTKSFTKDSPVSIPSGTYNTNERKHKLEKTLKEILNQKHENIMGYLLFYKIYYHIILYNINIVDTLRTNYINNTCLTSGTGTRAAINMDVDTTSINCVDISTVAIGTNVFTTSANANYVIKNLTDKFTKMKNNINLLNSRNFSYNTDFLDDKFKYTSQIIDLNTIRDEYQKTENALNSVLKDYNKYLKNFNNLKSYANFIIIILIIIIGLTIVITILDSLSSNFKNYYYLITFILLAFLTYIYYDNFRHINLYEDFYDLIWVNSGTPVTDDGNSYNCNSVILDGSVTSSNKANITTQIGNLYNAILQDMNNYNKEIKGIYNNLRNNIYTIGNKVFSQDANNYLYKLYLHKKNLNEVSRMKKINLTNIIETMKKHVIYLFNIILITSFFTLILLFGLLLFVNFPFYLYYIIAICVILILLVIIYFMFAIIQPTRMKANKNYWANVNPPSYKIKKLK